MPAAFEHWRTLYDKLRQFDNIVQIGLQKTDLQQEVGIIFGTFSFILEVSSSTSQCVYRWLCVPVIGIVLQNGSLHHAMASNDEPSP